MILSLIFLNTFNVYNKIYSMYFANSKWKLAGYLPLIYVKIAECTHIPLSAEQKHISTLVCYVKFAVLWLPLSLERRPHDKRY